MGKVLHLIFPTGLFKKNPYLNKEKDIAILEEKINFTYLPYHKAKLVLHRSTLKQYYDNLKTKGYRIRYYEFDEDEQQFLKGVHTIEFIYPCDHLIVQRWEKIAKKAGIELNILPTVNFLLTLEDIKGYQLPLYHDRSFYPFMRQKLGVLLTANGKPIGGKYSFDKENRKTLPAGITLPNTPTVNRSKYVQEAVDYVQKRFPHNYGEVENFIYPINSKTAKAWLKRFCEERLSNFGPYEDALLADTSATPILFHSCLAVSLNTGLLTDREVLEYILEYSSKHSVPLNSLEGFIRQLIGWRNYVFLVYEREGEKIRKMNFFKASRPLSNRWWKGKTQIPVVDMVIRKVNKYAYAHHIERLMVLGNFMLICGIDPHQVNNWFQAFVSIDAYDVFMIPNVLGMSQHADGGITMTRPYFSSSNYIKKMIGRGDGTKGLVILPSGKYEWDEVWDAVYYAFIDRHFEYLMKNYSTSRQALHWKNKKNKSKLLALAMEYLEFIETDV